MLRKKYMLLVVLVGLATQLMGQQISKEELIFLTPQWTGERFDDGRPKVSDALLKRMKSVSVEEAWAVMKNEGYRYQIAEDWKLINPDSVLVGPRRYCDLYAGSP